MALECEQLDAGEFAPDVWFDHTGWNGVFWYRVNTGLPILAARCPLLPLYGAALDTVNCPGCVVTSVRAKPWANRVDPDGTGGHTFVQVTYSTPAASGNGSPPTIGLKETELVASVETINRRRGLKFNSGDIAPSLRDGQQGWELHTDEDGDLFIAGGEGTGQEVGVLTAKVSVHRSPILPFQLAPLLTKVSDCPVNSSDILLPPVRGTFDPNTGQGLRLPVPKGMARFRTMEGPELVGATIRLTFHIALARDWFAYWDQENRDGQPQQERIFASKIYPNDPLEALWA